MLTAQPRNPPAPEPIQDELDDLEKLATELRARGYAAHLATPPGRLPHLETHNPHAPALRENIYTHTGSFYWSWADAIAPHGQIADAADIIAHVLRTSEEFAADIPNTTAPGQQTAHLQDPGDHAVTTHNTTDGGPALPDLEHEFGLICWTDGDQCYARRPTTPPPGHDARGDDPADLREAIILVLTPDPPAHLCDSP